MQKLKFVDWSKNSLKEVIKRSKLPGNRLETYSVNPANGRESQRILDRVAYTLGFKDDDDYIENVHRKRLILDRLRKVKQELLSKQRAK